MSARYQERLARIEKVLLIDNKKIDMTELRQGCLYGIPDSLRPLGWRLLLNYLPADRERWKVFLDEHRANYDALIEQLIVKPGEQDEFTSDHPLSAESSSEWNSYFADNQMLSQIDKDCRRLCPEMQFFQMKTKYPHRSHSYTRLSERIARADLETQEYDIANRKNVQKNSEKSNEEPIEPEEVNWQVAERILFIYAKVNPGVKYVQGMNEILGPIYYVMASDPDDEWARWAEHDAFFCFQQLMSEIKDNFIKTLDNSSCGIEYTMSSFHNLVQSVDVQLHDHLFTSLEIKPQFYAFRWLSLLLSQEFPLPDVITIWDSLLSDQARFSLLPFVCLSMLQMQRDELLKGGFAECVRLLQNYPAVDGAQLVHLALSIRDGTYKTPGQQQNGIKSRHMRTLSDKLKELKGILKR